LLQEGLNLLFDEVKDLTCNRMGIIARDIPESPGKLALCRNNVLSRAALDYATIDGGVVGRKSV